MVRDPLMSWSKRHPESLGEVPNSGFQNEAPGRATAACPTEMTVTHPELFEALSRARDRASKSCCADQLLPVSLSRRACSASSEAREPSPGSAVEA